MNSKMISNNCNITDTPPRNFEKVDAKDKYVKENNNNNLNLHNKNNNDSQQHNITVRVDPQDFSIYNKNIDYSEYDNSTLSETDATVAPLQRPMNDKVKISPTTTKPTATRITKDNKYSTNSFNKNMDSNEDNDNGEDYVVDKIYIMNGKEHLKNIHNYSKLPEESINDEIPDREKNAEDQLNDESLDEYEDCNEEEKLISNLEDKLPPDHHARRPMNAFLIFCKRHRAIVREKYPNLENR